LACAKKTFPFQKQVRETTPFIRETTNLLLFVAQYQILSTFVAALVIISESLAVFRLSDFMIGTILLCTNALLVLFSAFWCFSRLLLEREQQKWRRSLSPEELALVNKVMSTNALEPVEEGYDGGGQVVAGCNNKNNPGGSGGGRGGGRGNSVLTSGVSASSRYQQPQRQSALSQHLLASKDIVMTKRIGAGAFGEVFKGTAMGQPVAIKTMLNITEDNVRAFKAEILLTATLRHPNVVSFVGACWGQALMCLVLEWVSKGSLADFLSNDLSHQTATMMQGLHWDDPLLRFATDIARGMAYLHGKEVNNNDITANDGGATSHHHCILHRDLKPDNVLITEFSAAKVTDFGTSRAKGVEDVKMTAVGTPLFCAPEVARGEAYDESVDVYSFGLTLLDMAVQQDILEFIGERWAIAFGKTKVPKQPMRIIRPMTEEGWRPVTPETPVEFAPKTINALLQQCCAHDPKQRPSFLEIVEELKGSCKAEIRSKTFERRPRTNPPLLPSTSISSAPVTKRKLWENKQELLAKAGGDEIGVEMAVVYPRSAQSDEIDDVHHAKATSLENSDSILPPLMDGSNLLMRPSEAPTRSYRSTTLGKSGGVSTSSSSLGVARINPLFRPTLPLTSDRVVRSKDAPAQPRSGLLFNSAATVGVLRPSAAASSSALGNSGGGALLRPPTPTPLLEEEGSGESTTRPSEEDLQKPFSGSNPITKPDEPSRSGHDRARAGSLL
jgi:serine/threonine protein kinase